MAVIQIKQQESREISKEVEEFLAKGGKINSVPFGASAIDPITGVADRKVKDYLRSQKRSSKRGIEVARSM